MGSEITTVCPVTMLVFIVMQVNTWGIGTLSSVVLKSLRYTDRESNLRPFQPLTFWQPFNSQLQLVTTLTYDWWVAGMSMKDEWRSAREAIGGQCATITGMTLMHVWCADSLEYFLEVNQVT